MRTSGDTGCDLNEPHPQSEFAPKVGCGFRPFVAAVELGAVNAIGSATAVAMGEVLQAVRMN
jgi:hypothetical protein